MENIQGMDKVFYSELPTPSTILVNGGAGVLKTTFIVEYLKCQVKRNKDFTCLYIALKDNNGFLLSHFELDDDAYKNNIKIVELETILDYGDSDKRNSIFKKITCTIKDYEKKSGKSPSMVVIDPVNTIYTTVPMDDFRNCLYHFLNDLSSLNTQNWLVLEKCSSRNISYEVPFYFLSDGIIEMGMKENQNDMIRYMEVKKMRGINHSLNAFQVSYTGKQFKVLGPAY
ncbi:MAG: RAD55 family ATPase [Vulcanimicrobiota bacterium]